MRTILVSIKIFFVLTILTGIVYPLLIFSVSQLLFQEKANGSLIIIEGKIMGSELIGQQFDSSIYFTSRPSAISYNPLPSGGSNLSITNAKLKELVDTRRRQFIKINSLDSNTHVPPEMLFASASGLDPHISTEAALLQIDRISKIRNLDESQKNGIVNYIKSSGKLNQFSFLGDGFVNVLMLNIELDRICKNNPKNQ